MLFERKEWLSLIVSVIIISLAFTLQTVSVVFFLQALGIVAVAYTVRESLRIVMSRREGVDAKFEIWPVGLLVTIVSCILSGGIAVLTLPSSVKIKGEDSKRWMKDKSEISVREIGLASISGPLANLLLATLFLALFQFSGLQFFRLGALINFWISFSNLLPIPPVDGAKVMSWDRWMWVLSITPALLGLIGLLVQF